MADFSADHKIRPGKILCIGKNYALHAAEMRSQVPKAPVVFLKPSTALVRDGGAVILPALSEDVHHEVELVAVIGQCAHNVSEHDALSFVEGYAVGLDMTARDLQDAAKRKGHPWSVSKGFDTFAPLGTVVSARDVPDPQDLELALTVNGINRQRAHTSAMVFSVAALVAWCSSIFTLEPGDLLYTGTPHGVGPVHAGDLLVATCTGLPPLRVRVRREAV